MLSANFYFWSTEFPFLSMIEFPFSVSSEFVFLSAQFWDVLGSGILVAVKVCFNKQNSFSSAFSTHHTTIKYSILGLSNWINSSITNDKSWCKRIKNKRCPRPLYFYYLYCMELGFLIMTVAWRLERISFPTLFILSVTCISTLAKPGTSAFNSLCRAMPLN